MSRWRWFLGLMGLGSALCGCARQDATLTEPSSGSVQQRVTIAGTCSLQVMNGDYVTAEGGGGGAVNANRTSVGPWETFQLELADPVAFGDGSRVLFQTSGGSLLQADNGGGSGMNAASTNPGPWETFTVHRLAGPGPISPGDAIAIQANDGHYLTAEGGGGGVVNANRTAIGPWETWTFLGTGGAPPPPPPPPPPALPVTFQASNGQFMTAEGGGGGAVNANRPSASIWETFNAEPVNGGALADGSAVRFGTYAGDYLQATNGGGASVNAASTNPGPWETFTLHRLAGGGAISNGDAVSIQASNGDYVTAEGGGGGVVNANRTAVGPWETWTFGGSGGTGPFPPVPTRDQVLSINLQFQGLTVNTAQYGQLPWFEAALAWLTPADRQAVYAAKHAVGDTHCIIALPSGPALYDEPNQPYSADRFGPLDWTNGGTAMDPKFVALVEEVIENGFTPLIFLGGDAGEQGFPIAMQQTPLVTNALAGSSHGDLNLYVVKIPGWDGVFYGYTPQHVQQWVDYARQLSPNGYIGLEHNTGHIPVGNGPADYAPGGMLTNLDVILSEFDNGTALQGSANDSVWQIVGRLTRPYNRPPDQPAGDDPNPPFYLATPSARGPYYYVCFEFEEYTWVHNWYGRDQAGRDAAAAQIAQERAYLRSIGCQHTG